MEWNEFCTLLAGLMPDTPLGNIVQIRSEKDQKTIKSFSPTQRKIHSEWRKRIADNKLVSPDKLSADMKALENTMEQLFGGVLNVSR